MVALTADIAVLGGGVIGQAIALELARQRGVRVALVDAGNRGGEASPAAAGLLPVASSLTRAGAMWEAMRSSAGLYAEWLPDLERASPGVQLASRPGFVRLARNEEEGAALFELVETRRGQGFRAEFLDAAAVRPLLSGISPGAVAGGAVFWEDALLDCRALLAALGARIEALGGVLVRGAEVASIQVQPERSVELRGCGIRVSAGAAVLCAGWWSAKLARQLGVRLPLRPARGEMLAVRCARFLRHVVACEDTRLIPRGEEVWIGSTVEYRADSVPTAAAREDLLGRAAELFPHLRDAEVRRQWVGIRPCSTIHRPIVDRVPGLPQVVVATGHHRSGYLWAPITARHATALLLGGDLPVPAGLFAWRSR